MDKDEQVKQSGYRTRKDGGSKKERGRPRFRWKFNNRTSYQYCGRETVLADVGSLDWSHVFYGGMCGLGFYIILKYRIIQFIQ